MRARIGGVDIEYEVGGSGPRLTFAHALGADRTLWEGIAGRFAERFTVLRYDARGHGASGLGDAPASMATLAADAAGLLDHLGAGRTVWVGLSLGGMVGQHLALDHPGRVAALVLADTTAGYPASSHPMWRERQAAVRGPGGMATVVDGTLARWFTEAFHRAEPEAVERFRRMLLATPPEGYVAGIEALVGHDVAARLGAIRCPALVVVGADDAATPPAHAEALQRGIRGAALHVIPEAAHIAPVEQPERFIAILDAFLAGLPDRAP